jgi:hypothetical protein
MEGLKPELTSFLRQAKSSSLNVTDSDDHIFSASTGLAGLASIAGGFDQVLLAAGAGGGALPSFQVNKSFVLLSFSPQHDQIFVWIWLFPPGKSECEGKI